MYGNPGQPNVEMQRCNRDDIGHILFRRPLESSRQTPEGEALLLCRFFWRFGGSCRHSTAKISGKKTE